MTEIENHAAAAAPDAINEQFCTTGGIELCYETIGDPSDPALLLIVGLGSQLVAGPASSATDSPRAAST